MASSYPQYQDSPSGAEKPSNSDIAPAVPFDVICKLLGFTAAMIIAPIGMYFLTVESVFKGSTTYAGVTAAVTANVILFAYIIVAWRDDQGERAAQEKEKKKAQ